MPRMDRKMWLGLVGALILSLSAHGSSVVDRAEGAGSVTGPSDRLPVLDFQSCPKPGYPKESAQLGESGTVLLKFLIGQDGRILNAAVEASSGYARLDGAALTAFSGCRFSPGATHDGKAIESWYRLKYTFKLADPTIEELSARIEHNRNDAMAYFFRAALWLKAGKIEQAIADYGMVLQLEPTKTDAYWIRVALLLEKGATDQIMADLTRMIEMNPGLADALILRGLAWVGRGDLANAAADMDSASRLNRNSLFAKLALDSFRKLTQLELRKSRMEQMAAQHESP